ncbi:MAG: polysaccharide biosynthesis/export family protein [Bacteroidia bacterium]
MRKLILLLSLLFLVSCRSMNPSVMFKANADYPYKIEQTIGNVEYKIAPNDIIGLSVYTNDGFKLIDLTASTASVTNFGTGGFSGTNVQYVIDIEGFVKLPIIGRVKLKDFTIRDAEKLLETQFAVYYNKPFVMLSVLNRRVMVFTGTGGTGTVVTLTNENTTLIEALALAGGITETGKAYKIKLIRGDSRNPQLQLVDLSTIEGMQQSNMLLQANDIIYVEPVPRISNAVLAQIVPIVGILTSVLLMYDIIINRSK